MEKPHAKSSTVNNKSVKQSTAATSPSHSTVSSWSSNSGGMVPYQNKSPTRENNKPQDVKLHTQHRATKRAMFNYMVATKLSLLEQQRKQEEKLHKMIEEEEIRLMRKEMIPRAQLMPFFNRPFIPQRSTRPLTIPREPSFYNKCFTCISDTSASYYGFQQTNSQAPIK